jgi:hypothetical protein
MLNPASHKYVALVDLDNDNNAAALRIIWLDHLHASGAMINEQHWNDDRQEKVNTREKPVPVLQCLQYPQGPS